MIDKPGIYDITNEEYHSNCCIEPCLSRGTIMDLLFKSPAHAFNNHPAFTPQKEKNEAKFDIGSSAHSLFLEGVDKCVVIKADDWRKKETKEQRDEAYRNGLIPLLESQYEDVRCMVEVAEKALAESELQTSIAYGRSESSIFWKEDNVWFKVRTDWMEQVRPIILDYKTSDSANPEDFGRKAVSLGYDVQDALYTRGFKAHFGDYIDPPFIFMVQEITKPYLCSFISLSPEFKYMGKQKVEAGIGLWKQCISTGKWPGYPNRIAYIEPPPWAAMWQMKATFIGSNEEDL